MFRRWLIHKSSIQHKFLISTFVLALIPLGLFGAVMLQISKSSIESQVSQSNLKTLGQIAEKTDMLLDDIIAVSNMFYLNDEVVHAFTTDIVKNSYEEALIRTAFEKLMSNAIYSFGQLQYQVSLVGLNGLRLSSHPVNQDVPIQRMLEEPWYVQAAEAKGRILWVTEPIQGLDRAGKAPAFQAVRVSNRFESGAPAGMVVISVDERTMQNLYKGSLDEKQKIIVVNEKGTVISAEGRERLSSTNLEDRSYYPKISQYDSGYFIDKEAGAEQLISFQTIGKTGWKLVSYTPTSTVLRSMNQLQLIALVVLAAVAALSLAASYVIARRQAVPIKRLYRDFDRVETGDLTIRTPVTSDDELGLLSRKFNRMVERLQELLEGITREQQQKRHAELQALQSQINPHFLYNTLASIRFMLVKQQNEVVDSMIVALVKLLKQSISKHDELIPIAEELEMLRNYLYIQEIRQGHRLTVVYELEDDISAYKTIKLILQPLVENAIFHGLEPKPGPGKLTVRGYLRKGEIHFEVCDNGMGFLANDPAPVQAEERGPSAEGAPHQGGLHNVNERIRLHFGAEYGVQVESVSDEGTTVRVRIPAIYKWKEVQTGHENTHRG